MKCSADGGIGVSDFADVGTGSWGACCTSIGIDDMTGAAGTSSDVGTCDGSISAIKSSIASTAAVGAGVDGADSGVVGCATGAGAESGASGDVLPSGSSVIASITTVPANGVGRSSVSQISAGARRSRVKLCDQPDSLVMVAFQMALPSDVGCSMPCSCKTLKTAVLLAGMPFMPCASRCARSLSETVLLTSHSASSVSQPSEAWGWFSFSSCLSR